jgi:hypothetical protein
MMQMNCKNCGHCIFYLRGQPLEGYIPRWTHKRAVWEFGINPLLKRLDECRDCGCEYPEPEEGES